MPIYSIYKVTNKINHKVYIGFDSNWPSRKQKHFWNCDNDTNKQHYKFYRAIKKYGKNNFEWEVIYQSLDGSHCKNIMESFFIKEYNSFIGWDNCNGYNMTTGGDGTLGIKGELHSWWGKKHSEESKKKMSDSAKGRIFTEETKKKMSLSLLGKKKKPFTDEHRKKLSEANLGKKYKLRKNKQQQLLPPDGTCCKINSGNKEIL